MKDTKLKSDNLILIGANIKALREKSGLKPMEVSRRVQLLGVGLTREALVKIEADKQHISASQFVALADVLDANFEDFLKKKNDK